MTHNLGLDQAQVAATAKHWLGNNVEKLREKMKTLGLRDEPIPLPEAKFFQNFHDEL